MSKAREALAELVACKDLQRSMAQANHHAAMYPTDENYAVIDALNTDHGRRQPLAWEAARAALAIPEPEASGNANFTTVLCPSCGYARATTTTRAAREAESEKTADGIAMQTIMRAFDWYRGPSVSGRGHFQNCVKAALAASQTQPQAKGERP